MSLFLSGNDQTTWWTPNELSRLHLVKFLNRKRGHFQNKSREKTEIQHQKNKKLNQGEYHHVEPLSAIYGQWVEHRSVGSAAVVTVTPRSVRKPPSQTRLVDCRFALPGDQKVGSSRPQAGHGVVWFPRGRLQISSSAAHGGGDSAAEAGLLLQRVAVTGNHVFTTSCS